MNDYIYAGEEASKHIKESTILAMHPPSPNPTAINVCPETDYTIKVDFDNGEKKIFDVAPWLYRRLA